MSRISYWAFHICNFLAAGTGLVYGWMRYLSRPPDEFAVVNHPWQPDLQHAHILVAPLLVAMLGYFWGMHFLPKWRGKIKPGRRSGLGLVMLAVPMVISGYLVQVSVSDIGRLVWIWVHGVSATLWILVSLLHTGLHWIARRSV